MRLDYALFDPTGNITILVETPVPPASQPHAAARLMREEPSAEQVGFLFPAAECDLGLRMAGGEFCGNASMCAAVLRGMDAGLREGRVVLRVSGAEEPVTVDVERLSAGSYRGRVSMPPPASAGKELFPDGIARPVVRFQGITHVILEQPPDRAAAEALAPVWCGYLGAAALGMMFLDSGAGTMTPLVYVPGADTLCWENSCASGTTAAAAWLARGSADPLTLSLRQPGGVLAAEVVPGGGFSLTGVVALRKRGSLEVTLD